MLTFEEESILNYIYDKQRGLPVRMPKQKSERTELAKQGFKKCKMCGEILPLTQFYKHFGICKECYSIKRNSAITGTNKSIRLLCYMKRLQTSERTIFTKSLTNLLRKTN